MLKTAMKVLYLLLLSLPVQAKYYPNWKSLDSRPLPSWYDEAKLGIFIHWGVFSVPSFGNEWFWWTWQGENSTEYVDFMNKSYPPGFQYTDFAPLFTAEFFNASEWVDLFKSSGAKYVVLTSKHHEGFTNWPSASSWNWNSLDVGPHRDLVGDLAMAIRNNSDIRFGVYHSLFEWFNPLFLTDRASIFHSNDFVKKKCLPELYDLVNRYKPEVIWSDGQWEASYKYWKSTEFLAWLYNESPVKDSVVTNDRWGMLTPCNHGGYFTCMDRYNPGVLQRRKWENAMTLDKLSWGYRRNAKLQDFITIDELIETFVTTISCGGNMLMNVGPTKDGRIVPIFEERLKQMGEWLNVAGEAVYSTVPWRCQNDTSTSGVWYTAKGDDIYAFFFDWPESGSLVLGSPQPLSKSSQVIMLGTSSSLDWEMLKSTGISIHLKSLPRDEIRNDWVWVLKLEKFQ